VKIWRYIEKTIGMKHIKLFEKFLVQESNSGGSTTLQFFPFDDQKVPQSKYGLSDEISFVDLIKLEGQPIPDSAWEIGPGSCGIYIAHTQTPDKGILRVIPRSLNPLSFDIAKLDDKYTKKFDIEGLSKESIGEIMKRPDGLSILSEVRTSFPELYDFLSSKTKGAKLAADLGDLFY
jgi:hypothetical protein